MATQNNVLYMKRFILLRDYVYVFNEIHFCTLKALSMMLHTNISACFDLFKGQMQWRKLWGFGGARPPPPQSAMSSENLGFRRIIDNRSTCRNYSKNSFCKGILS